MPTYKQVVNHVKKHVLWKDEYFERYYRLNPELVQKLFGARYLRGIQIPAFIMRRRIVSLPRTRP